jgi:WD40 repeat protein
MKRKMQRRIWILLSIPVILIICITGYIHLFYQPQKIDNGMAILKKSFMGHANIVTAVRFSPDDSLVVTGSVDSTVKIWKRETGELIRTIHQPQGISYLDLSVDGNFIATGSYDETVRIWRVSDGSLVKELKGSRGTIWTVAFSPDGKLLASSGDDNIIRIWNTATGELLHTLKGHKRIVWSVKFSPNGARLVSSSFDFSFKLWNVADGKLLRDNTAHTETVVDIAFSNDGKMLASTSDDCTIRLWNAENGSFIRSMEVPEHVQAVAFSPDDKRLMTGGRDKTLIGELVQNFLGNAENNKGVSARLWDVQTGKLLQTFAHHGNDVMDIAYSHTGKWIATASADNTVDVWRVLK